MLINRIDEKELKLTPQERQFVDQFDKLARAADDAAAKFNGKHRRGIILDDINHMIEDFHSLAGKNLTSTVILYGCSKTRTHCQKNSGESNDKEDDYVHKRTKMPFTSALAVSYEL